MAKAPAPSTTAAARSARANRQPRYHTSGRFAAGPTVRAAPVAKPPAPVTLAKVAPGIAKATGAAKAAK
jgi:hypothetical protein